MKKCSRGFIKHNQTCIFKPLSLKHGIDHNDILKTLSYYKEPYYDKYIDYIKNNTIEYKLKENELNLMISYLSRKTSFLGISFRKPKCIYRKITLNDSQLKNFYYCLSSNHFTISSLPSTFYCCCSDIDIDFPIKAPDCTISSIVQLFGIEQFHLLDYINLDKIHYFSSTKAGKHSTNELNKYKDILHSYSPYIQSKSIIMSSMMLYAIGTTTAMDVDIIVSNRYHECNSMIQSLEKNGIDVKILRHDDHWEEKGMILNWMKKSFSNDWVHHSGHHEINDFFMDSSCFFYLHQLKFVSLTIQIQRLNKRNSINSYVDLLAIHFNNRPITFQCIQPIQFRQGKIDIISHSTYKTMIKTIKDRLYDWQSISLSLHDIQSKFPLCSIKEHSNLNHFFKYLDNIIHIYQQTYTNSYTCLFNFDHLPKNIPFVILHTINTSFLTNSIHLKSFSIHKGKDITVSCDDKHFIIPKTIHLPHYTLYERTKLLEQYDHSLDYDELHIARLFITYVFRLNV